MVPTNFQSNMMSFNPLSQNAVSGTNQTSPTLLPRELRKMSRT
jgi:hypothetical protein